jgi:murein DD-endopeptidase MepM/ murein hydrolase activator NlpD
MRVPRTGLVVGILTGVLLASCTSTTAPTSAPGTTAAGAGRTIGTARGSGESGALAGVRVPDGFTAVGVQPIGDPTFPWLGSDGKYHIDYDVMVTNMTPIPATLDKVEVVDAFEPTKVFATYAGAQLAVDPPCADGECDRLRELPSQPAKNTALAPNESRALLVDFTVDAPAQAPKAVLHHVFITGAPGPPRTGSLPVDYLAGPFDTSGGTPRVIGPPVRGPNWVALNGCCAPNTWHRSALLAVNGKLNNSQRFAIDWKETNAQGEFYTGDKTKNESYVDYGSKIYAVADGTVVSILDDVEANAPGVLPSTNPELRAKLTVANADGNHIILDIGGGVYAMYAHMIKGTLKVKPGDKVKKGDVIGELGNTGNANASHMHFQLMNDPSILEGDSLPYVIDQFTYRGQLDAKAFADSDDYLTGGFFPPGLPAGQPRTEQLPNELAIVDFPNP